MNGLQIGFIIVSGLLIYSGFIYEKQKRLNRILRQRLNNFQMHNTLNSPETRLKIQAIEKSISFHQMRYEIEPGMNKEHCAKRIIDGFGKVLFDEEIIEIDEIEINGKKYFEIILATVDTEYLDEKR